MGPDPGLLTMVCQLEPAFVIIPPCNEGISPQYMKEDLPLPEAPKIAKNLPFDNLTSASSL